MGQLVAGGIRGPDLAEVTARLRGSIRCRRIGLCEAMVEVVVGEGGDVAACIALREAVAGQVVLEGQRRAGIVNGRQRRRRQAAERIVGVRRRVVAGIGLGEHVAMDVVVLEEGARLRPDPRQVLLVQAVQAVVAVRRRVAVRIGARLDLVVRGVGEGFDGAEAVAGGRLPFKRVVTRRAQIAVGPGLAETVAGEVIGGGRLLAGCGAAFLDEFIACVVVVVREMATRIAACDHVLGVVVGERASTLGGVDGRGQAVGGVVFARADLIGMTGIAQGLRDHAIGVVVGGLADAIERRILLDQAIARVDDVGRMPTHRIDRLGRVAVVVVSGFFFGDAVRVEVTGDARALVQRMLVFVVGDACVGAAADRLVNDVTECVISGQRVAAFRRVRLRAAIGGVVDVAGHLAVEIALVEQVAVWVVLHRARTAVVATHAEQASHRVEAGNGDVLVRVGVGALVGRIVVGAGLHRAARFRRWIGGRQQAILRVPGVPYQMTCPITCSAETPHATRPQSPQAKPMREPLRSRPAQCPCRSSLRAFRGASAGS